MAYNASMYMPQQLGQQGYGYQQQGAQYQWMPQSPWQAAQPYNNLRSVSGIDGAKALASGMPPNSKDTAFDANEDVFYLISTDAGGFPTISEFEFFPKKRKEDPAASVEYATKEDLEALRDEISAMKHPAASKSARTARRAADDGE